MIVQEIATTGINDPLKLSCSSARAVVTTIDERGSKETPPLSELPRKAID
jgi:hypothetical protein